MKKMYFLLFFLVTQFNFSQFNYQRAWATYFGGAMTNLISAATDNQGNIIFIIKFTNSGSPLSSYTPYTTSGTFMPDLLPSTNLAYVLAKMSPNGQLVWGTYIGQYSYSSTSLDNFFVNNSLAIDSNNNIYFSGNTKRPTGVATPNTFMQIKPNVDPNGNDEFLMKFDSTGNKVWGTYLLSRISAMTIDSNDNLLFSGTTTSSTSIATAGSYQENIINYTSTNSVPNNTNFYLEKFDSSGNQLSGTYLGIANDLNFYTNCITTDVNNNIILGFTIGSTLNTTLTTLNCYQNTQNGDNEIVLMKLNSALTTKYWGTFFGGNLMEKILKICCNGTDIYFCGINTVGMGTPNVFMPLFPLANSSGPAITKFNELGNRIWTTYLPRQTFVNDLLIQNNKIYIMGYCSDANYLNNYISTDAYQTNFGGVNDHFFAQFNLDGTSNWLSYYGGEKAEISFVSQNNRILNYNNDFYLIGNTLSTTGMSTLASFQSNFVPHPTSSSLNSSNIFLANFKPTSLSVNTFDNSKFSLSPNPNNGNFSLVGNFNENATLIIYDNLGREIISRKIENNRSSQTFNLENELKSGVYFAKLVNENGLLQTFKVLVQP